MGTTHVRFLGKVIQGQLMSEILIDFLDNITQRPAPHSLIPKLPYFPFRPPRNMHCDTRSDRFGVERADLAGALQFVCQGIQKTGQRDIL